MKEIFYDARNYTKPEEDICENILFELTTHCNLNCPFCLNASSSSNDEFMTLEDFKTMVDRLDGKVSLLQLSGGEPLTNPHFMDMVDYLLQKKLSFHINTNGTLVTDELISKLLAHEKMSIQFSLDGAQAATDDYIRCQGHFDKIIDLMKKLHKHDFTRGAIKMVINQLNYHEIEDFFYLGMEYGFLPSYAFLVKSGRADNNWDNLYLNDSLRYEAREQIRQLLDHYAEYFQRFKNPNVLVYLRNMNISYVGECQFNLPYHNFTPLVHPNGDTHPCEGLFQQEFCIGNLLRQLPEEIFTHSNELVKKLDEKARKRRLLLNNIVCISCPLNMTCGKGCIAESYNAGDFYGRPSDCYFRERDFTKILLMGGTSNE